MSTKDSIARAVSRRAIELVQLCVTPTSPTSSLATPYQTRTVHCPPELAARGSPWPETPRRCGNRRATVSASAAGTRRGVPGLAGSGSRAPRGTRAGYSSSWSFENLGPFSHLGRGCLRTVTQRPPVLVCITELDRRPCTSSHRPQQPTEWQRPCQVRAPSPALRAVSFGLRGSPAATSLHQKTSCSLTNSSPKRSHDPKPAP